MPTATVPALEERAQRLYRALLTSTETYIEDGQYEAFSDRQEALWDAVHAEGDRIERAVLALLRGDRLAFHASVAA